MTNQLKSRHIVLLGDSIFDNAAYVPDGMPVIKHLRQAIPANWNVTLLAVDGSVTSDVPGQMAMIPASATCLVISVGGNDALKSIEIVRMPVSTVGEALHHLSEIRNSFQKEYRKMLMHVLSVELPVAVCTIYNTVPGIGNVEKTALALFNEIILQEAVMAKVAVIDLRIVCNEVGDYSPISPIEPSHQGGAKIAHAIHSLLA